MKSESIPLLMLLKCVDVNVNAIGNRTGVFYEVLILWDLRYIVNAIEDQYMTKCI